jgi:hypothetical protein
MADTRERRTRGRTGGELDPPGDHEVLARSRVQVSVEIAIFGPIWHGSASPVKPFFVFHLYERLYRWSCSCSHFVKLFDKTALHIEFLKICSHRTPRRMRWNREKPLFFAPSHPKALWEHVFRGLHRWSRFILPRWDRSESYLVRDSGSGRAGVAAKSTKMRRLSNSSANYGQSTYHHLPVGLGFLPLPPPPLTSPRSLSASSIGVGRMWLNQVILDWRIASQCAS